MRSTNGSVQRLPSRRRTVNIWSTSDIRQLRDLAAAGVPAEIIAVTLQRTHSAVKNKAGLHGIPLRSMTSGSLAATSPVSVTLVANQE